MVDGDELYEIIMELKDYFVAPVENYTRQEIHGIIDFHADVMRKHYSDESEEE